jgi:ATP-dependent Clp protease protease subunit
MPKRASTTHGRRSGNQMTRASFTSGGFSSADDDALLMNTIRAGGMVVPRHEAGDPFGLLLRQRIVFLGNQVDDFTADAVISQLLLLDAQDPKKVRDAPASRLSVTVLFYCLSPCRWFPRCLVRTERSSPPSAHPPSNVLLQDIKLFINSPGGSVTAGMGIYDAMQMCRADVSTVCMGLAASMGAFLLTSGAKGKRLSMPNARIMIHQPLGGASGQAVDIEIQAKEIMFHKANLNRLMAFHTGQDVKQIDEDTDRDRYMSPLEAKNYGIIDEIIGGDDAGLKIEGQPKDYLKTKASYISWGDELDGVDSGKSMENAV